MKAIVIVVCFVSVCFAQCGTYTSPGGLSFDLDPLTKSADYIGSDDFGYTYQWNFCKDIVSRDYCYTPSPVIQSVAVYCVSTGYLPANISSHPDGEGQGVVVTYENTIATCGHENIPRVSQFILTCDASTEYNLGSISEPQMCQYKFQINTKYACPTGSSSSISITSSVSSISSSSSSGSSGAGFLVPLWITAISSLVIVLLLVVLIIVVIAVLLAKKKAKGFMALSNGEMIELPN